jgi:intein/homing endonuclease
MSAFIKGYFDGDGSIGFYKSDNKFYPKITFTSGSKKFLLGLKNELKIKNSVNRKTSNLNCWFLSFGNKNDILKFQKMILEVKNFVKTEKIKKIEMVGTKPTFDITTQKNHNFILGNGVLTHNCHPHEYSVK